MQRTRADRRKRIIEIVFPLVLLVVLVAIDQFTKYCFKELYLKSGNTIIIENFFTLTYTVNTGAAWSFLSGVSWAQAFFKILTSISLVLFSLFYVYAVKKRYKWLNFSLVLVIAGTIGNFIDRLAFNGVIDFLSFTFWGWNFPVFNFADSCLTVGVVMLIVHYFFFDKDAIFKKRVSKNDKDETTVLKDDQSD